MRLTTHLLLIPLAATLGCGKSDEYQPQTTPAIPVAKVALGDEATLAPLAVGNQWVYTRTQGNMTSEITLKVEEVRQTPQGTEATISASTTDAQGEVVSQTLVWRIDDTGLYQVTTDTDTIYDPPQLLIPFPLETHKEFQHEGTGGRPVGGPGAYKATLVVLGPQEVDTDNGRMSAFAIQTATEWETEDGPAVSNTLTWWKPGIGFVRQVQEVRTQGRSGKIILKLKSHSFPRS